MPSCERRLFGGFEILDGFFTNTMGESGYMVNLSWIKGKNQTKAKSKAKEESSTRTNWRGSSRSLTPVPLKSSKNSVMLVVTHLVIQAQYQNKFE
jgi:hypothetical protein